MKTIPVTLYAILLMATAYPLAGCGGTSADAIGSIAVSRSEVESAFGSSPSITSQDFDAATANVVAREPSITSDREKFARATFEELKRIHVGRDSIDTFNRMTAEEILLALAFIDGTWFAKNVKPDAFGASSDAFPCGANSPTEFNDDKADAVRHAYWMAIMAKRASESPLLSLEDAVIFARRFGIAHEQGKTDQRAQMDLANNEVGLAILSANPQATEAQLLELIVSQPFEYFEPGANISANTSRLAYFVGKAPFDGTYRGTLTNPDGGRNWDVVFSLTQCGEVIRGEWKLTGGSYLAIRRVSGSVINGQMNLTVSNPYVWEVENLHYCEGIQATANASATSMSGSWTSTNCHRGGVFTFTR